MASKFGSWWQKVKQHWVAIGVVGIGLVVAITLIIFGYWLDWTGFNGNTKSGKTLWDWLQLLIIPIMLVIGGFWLNQIQKSREEKVTELRTKSEREAAEKHAQTDREIALDNQREAALQDYIDKMSELLLKEHLSELKPEYEEVRRIAQVRTLTLLPRLDGKRKGSVLQFLQESKLIVRDKVIVYLKGADLSHAELQWADLSNADLSITDLREANLWSAHLDDADLSHADLRGAELNPAILMGTILKNAQLQKADLSGSLMRGTDLSFANLYEANLYDVDLGEADLTGIQGITVEELEKKARLLKGATMPDGSKHP